MHTKITLSIELYKTNAIIPREPQVNTSIRRKNTIIIAPVKNGREKSNRAY